MLLSCVVSLSCCAPLHAQRAASARKAALPLSTVARFDRGPRAIRIPLEIDNNIILLGVRVNGSKPLKFIFDTGASLSAIDSKRAAELGLKSTDQLRANATGGSVEGSAIEHVELSVQGAKVIDQMIASLPFPTVPGFAYDGVLGCDFIRHFVVEIDYQKKMMKLFASRSYSYRGKGAVIRFWYKPGGTPLTRTTIIVDAQRPVEANLEIDTGGDGAFILNSPFVARHKLLETIPKTNESTHRGAGGEQPLVFGQVKAVRLGRIVFQNPPVGLSQETEGAGASEENDGRISGEIFRRFKVILDLAHNRMILEKNKSFSDPYRLETDDN
jgi:predicted aspartyl protease